MEIPSFNHLMYVQFKLFVHRLGSIEVNPNFQILLAASRRLATLRTFWSRVETRVKLLSLVTHSTTLPATLILHRLLGHVFIIDFLIRTTNETYFFVFWLSKRNTFVKRINVFVNILTL